MIVGNRDEVVMGGSYSSDHALYNFAEQVKNLFTDVEQTSTYGVLSETCKVLKDPLANDQIKKFFVENSCDPDEYKNRPKALKEHYEDMEQLYENDRQAVMENTAMQTINPIVGLTFPMHKLILMNMVFDKGAIPKAVAAKPAFTIAMERRLLIDTEGNELDLYKDQNKLTAAIKKTAAEKEIELTLPVSEETELVNQYLDGMAGVDHLNVNTYVCAVKVPNVYFEIGDVLPDENGYVGEGPVATEAATKDVWVRTMGKFQPIYDDDGRAIAHKFKFVHKVLDNTEVKVVEDCDIISGYMKNDRVMINSLKGVATAVKLHCRLDTSSANMTTCSVSWKHINTLIEIDEGMPINTTISPQEVKDIAAMYNVNQITKVLDITKTVLANYKDDDIKGSLDESYLGLSEGEKFFNTFDFAPRAGYTNDHVTWRRDTFFDFFDEEVEKMLRVLNDPNIVVTVFGDASIIRKIAPVEYSYQSPSNIGPVDLDYVKTVTTSHHRVYQFIASDKMRFSNELIVILCPRGTDRIIYKIYDYQTYVSNEIRDANNPSLPAIHAFERYKFVQYQPVQGRINIKNPTGLIPDKYDVVPVKHFDN